MARWKLNSSHYLNIVGEQAGEWEYEEQSRTNGRKVRRRFPVPLLLDVTDPACINDRENGYIIVANAPSAAHPRDYVFIGPPTPEMEAIDDEAAAISEKEAQNWVHPIEALPGQGFNQSLLTGLEKQLSDLVAVASTGRAAPVSNGPTREEFEAMQKQLAELMAQNAALQEAKAPAGRR